MVDPILETMITDMLLEAKSLLEPFDYDIPLFIDAATSAEETLQRPVVAPVSETSFFNCKGVFDFPHQCRRPAGVTLVDLETEKLFAVVRSLMGGKSRGHHFFLTSFSPPVNVNMS